MRVRASDLRHQVVGHLVVDVGTEQEDAILGEARVDVHLSFADRDLCNMSRVSFAFWGYERNYSLAQKVKLSVVKNMIMLRIAYGTSYLKPQQHFESHK